MEEKKGESFIEFFLFEIIEEIIVHRSLIAFIELMRIDNEAFSNLLHFCQPLELNGNAQIIVVRLKLELDQITSAIIFLVAARFHTQLISQASYARHSFEICFRKRN